VSQRDAFAILPSTKPPGRLVQLQADGIPERASMRQDSDYYWPEKNLLVFLGGVRVKRCIGFDRVAGYVEVIRPGLRHTLDAEGRPEPFKVHGDVRVVRP
jgi:hypothetical protein